MDSISTLSGGFDKKTLIIFLIPAIVAVVFFVLFLVFVILWSKCRNGSSGGSSSASFRIPPSRANRKH